MVRKSNRRRFLQSMAVSIPVLSGCAAPTVSTTSDVQSTDHDWPVMQYDETRTGCNLDVRGPESAPTERWSRDMGSVWGSPVLADGIVYVGSYDRHLYAINGATGDVLWQYRTGNRIDGTPAVSDGIVYFGGFDMNIYALDAYSGEEIWMYETDGYVRSSPIVVDDTLYIGGNCQTLECDWDHPETKYDHGDVFAIDAYTGELEWRYETADGVTSSPAVQGDQVFIGSSDHTLYALDAHDGDQVWEYTSSDMFIGTPTVGDSQVYIGDWDGRIISIDASSGEELWDFQTDSFYISGSPSVCDGTVYIGVAGAPTVEMQDDLEVHVRRGKVYALSADTGEERWSFITDAEEIGSTPAVGEHTVFIGSHSLREEFSGGVYALDSATGEMHWEYLVPGIGVGGSPAIANGDLYFGIIDDRVSGRLVSIG